MNRELDFPVGIWETFATQRPPVRCSSGYLIYLQDTEATCFYYLKSGKVKSFIQSADGAERILNIHTTGSLFGEASFFDELPRVSSALALTPCEIVPIDRELVTQEFAQNPDLALAMMKYLARTVRMLSEQVDQMAFRPAKWRIANYLLTFSPVSGPVSCTQEDIAAAISSSRITVSRVLGEFARQGWISLGYRTIALLQPEQLQKLCQV